jgi:hypothetical protein
MRSRLRQLLFGATLFLSPMALFAGDEEVQDDDLQAIREWINTKRQVTVKELGGALSISGEVRTEWQTTLERKNGVNQRGLHSPCGVPTNAFDVEVNLMLDYRTDKSWASIKLEFDNDAGVFSGTFNRLKVERAYFAVRVMDTETLSMDVEFGRRRLATIFDSLIEFDSFFDGILFKYDQAFEKIADFYFHLGAFVIDDRINQFGYVGEIGLMEIGHTGLYAKYSLIDWKTKHFDSPTMRNRFNFIVSQWILGYKFIPKFWQKAVTLFGAVAYNHAAHRLSITHHNRANLAGYVGFVLGELKKRNDWALQANYQVVQAQAISDFDSAGIGLGNACRTGFYTVKSDGTGGPTKRKNAAGNTNYRGFSITLDYLILNNLDIQQSWNQSITLDDHIGPFRRYRQYELELIYLF